LLPEEAGVLVVKTMCGKSPAKATVAMATNKRQQVAALCHAVLAVADICETTWVSWRGLFSKTVKSEAQNRSEKTVATEKCFAGAMANFSMEANGSLGQVLLRWILACCPGSLLDVLIEIRLFSRTTRSRTPPFPLRKNCCVLAC
jgi:hypothetical protein